jgi:ABC-type xylose transport system permease subunit
MTKELVKRWKAPTPKFWKKVQRVAIVAGTIAGIILTAPVSLPAVVVTAAGYVVAIGTTVATTAQLTKEPTKIEENVDDKRID